MRDKYWPIIEQVRQGQAPVPTSDNQDVFRDLLDSRALLQYVNDEEWYAVNPLVGKPPQP